MSRGSPLARLMLYAYPRAFRRDYGDEITRSITDLRTHGDHSRAGVIRVVAVDVVRTAPRMRLESVMNNHKAVAITAVVTVAVIAALVGSPTLLLFIAAAVAAMAILLRRGDQPIVTDPTATTRWWRWIVAGAASFAVGGAVAAIDGPELSTVGWTTWMVSWTTGLVLVLFGLVLASSKLLHRRA